MGEKDEGLQAGDPVSGLNVAKSIGMILSNATLYGAKHGVTTSATERCYEQIIQHLQTCDYISFNVIDGKLLIDGQIADTKNGFVQGYMDTLIRLDMPGLAFTGELTPSEFAQLIGIMTAKPALLKASGGAATLVERLGLSHVYAKQVQYRHIDDDEVVIEQEVLEEKEAEVEEARRMQEIMAFLEGDDSLDVSRMAEELKDVAKEPDKLAELIMRAAEVQQETAADIEGGESFGNLVVGCLRQTCDTLLKSKSLNSQKGKKAMEKTLMLLERDVLERLREVAGDDIGDCEETVHEMIQCLTDELQIDALASEYMKKRNAIDSSEERLRKFIKAKGEGVDETVLKQKLLDEGMSLDEWQLLVGKSGVAPAGGPGVHLGGDQGAGGGASDVTGMLGLLLTALDKKLARPEDRGESDAEVHRLVEEVDKEVEKAAAHTEAKLAELAKEVEDAAPAPGEDLSQVGKTQPLRRLIRIDILAEIVQELCQPLSVVNCSIDMISAKYAGEVTDQQVELLTMAKNSSDRIQQLVNELTDIAGMPSGMAPEPQSRWDYDDGGGEAG